jgi:hypothetical protein
MCDGLLKHPNEEDGGIFTRCVKYCQEHDAAYKLSDVWELASDLDAGRTPRRICSASSSGSSQLFVGGSDEEMEDGEDETVHRATSEASDDSVMGRDDGSVASQAF